MTFSSRRSVSSCWTSDSDGLAGSFDITTQAWLELAQPQMLHLAPQVARFHAQALDAFCGLERKPVQLSRIDQQADRQLLAVLLDHVLVAGHRPARDLHLLEPADPAGQHVERTSHVRNRNQLRSISCSGSGGGLRMTRRRSDTPWSTRSRATAFSVGSPKARVWYARPCKAHS